LAVLRNFLGLNQRELAGLADCSTRTIQAVELCTLKLSEKLATKISKATGASRDWLLQGDPDAPIVGERRKAFTREMFEALRERGEEELYDKVQGGWMKQSASDRALLLQAVLLAAIKNRKGGPALFRTLRFLDQMSEDFGMDFAWLEKREKKMARPAGEMAAWLAGWGDKANGREMRLVSHRKKNAKPAEKLLDSLFHRFAKQRLHDVGYEDASERLHAGDKQLASDFHAFLDERYPGLRRIVESGSGGEDVA